MNLKKLIEWNERLYEVIDDDTESLASCRECCFISECVFFQEPPCVMLHNSKVHFKPYTYVYEIPKPNNR